MKTVHKYPVPMWDFFSLDLPLGSEILLLGEQQGSLFLWVRFDTEIQIPIHVMDPGRGEMTLKMSTESRHFRLAGTGHPDAEGRHVGSVIQCCGLVWHLFELQEFPLRERS